MGIFRLLVVSGICQRGTAETSYVLGQMGLFSMCGNVYRDSAEGRSVPVTFEALVTMCSFFFLFFYVVRESAMPYHSLMDNVRTLSTIAE